MACLIRRGVPFLRTPHSPPELPLVCCSRRGVPFLRTPHSPPELLDMPAPGGEFPSCGRLTPRLITKACFFQAGRRLRFRVHSPPFMSRHIQPLLHRTDSHPRSHLVLLRKCWRVVNQDYFSFRKLSGPTGISNSGRGRPMRGISLLLASHSPFAISLLTCSGGEYACGVYDTPPVATFHL